MDEQDDVCFHPDGEPAYFPERSSCPEHKGDAEADVASPGLDRGH
jgi:hypothetical protein